ncbi:hypothetical protein TRFO_28727 [Tritrichomonas foetus]|uniref:Importin N-terminal domain-containing protein n=1 Tax=Tritrichomonas foetus TaxID=1144522 RepID=A0A1J4K2G7_9EUKA|nr:hypothetical protein TRFO_28727 [Tritrichomonas foetus]|eukprot:OHT03940.1 hypothetical protein TRFO_28727 [Tritrichomonas foetus]
MELEVFSNILNPDPQVRDKAVEIIQNAQNDPAFVNFLLNAVQSDAAKNNQVIFQSLLISLVDTARKHHGYIIEATRNPEVKQAMINILFSIPLESRAHIEECLLIVAPGAEQEFAAIFQSIFQTINPNSELADIYTAVSFAKKWIKRSLKAPFLSNFSQIILPFLQICVASELDDLKAKTISELAKLTKTLISSGHVIFNASLDEIFNIFNKIITQPIQTQSGLQMKTSIVILITKIVLCAYESWKCVEEMQEWRKHFISNVMPGIFQASLHASQQPMDLALSGRLFHLYYFFVSFEVMPQQILTPEFFTHIVIPSARLIGNDLIDYELNPIQYISFCCEHETVDFFSARVCASQFLSIVLKKYRNVFDPLPLIAQNSNDPLDFEARIFLLQRYTMEAELPPDIFETYFNLLTTEQPLYIVSALIRMITEPMAMKDAVVGISVAEHFIINAEDPIVQYSAVRLMDRCFKDFESQLDALNGIVELNTAELFPALLKLSNNIHLPEPTNLIKKIFKIGPVNYMNIVSELVMRFFQLWRENQAMEDDINQIVVGPSLMESITTVLESVPADSPLIQTLAPAVLQQLAADMVEFPLNSSISDQIRVAAVFSRKLSVPTEAQIQFIQCLIQMNLDPLDFDIESFIILVCPLILNQNIKFLEMGFEHYLLGFCETVLKDDPSSDKIAQCLVLASCLIQAKGIQYFPFITTASQILQSKPLVSFKNKPLIIYGVLYVFASALFVDAAQAQLLFVSEIPDIMCELLLNCTTGSYREIKMAVYVLTWFAKFGHKRSFDVAASLFKSLFDMKALDEIIEITPDTLIDRANLHAAEQLTSLSPLIQMPFDSVDELTFFMEFSAQSGMIDTIPGGLEALFGQ